MATDYLYENFLPTETCHIIEKNKSSTYQLQCLFYSTLLEGSEEEGMELFLPPKHGGGGGPNDDDSNRNMPAVSGRSTHVPTRSQEEDTVSIRSGTSVRSGISSKMNDSASVCSGLLGGNIPHGGSGSTRIPQSASGYNIAGSSSIGQNECDDGNDEQEDDADDDGAKSPENIYEDIATVCDSMLSESEGEDEGDEEEEVLKSVNVAKQVKKAPSFFDMLKAKAKKGKKKNKEMAVKKPATIKADTVSTAASKLLESREDTQPQAPSTPKMAYLPPNSIPPSESRSRSSSESYDEMHPRNSGYISDSYEDIQFGADSQPTVDSHSTTTWAAEEQPLPPPVNFEKLKDKLKQRPKIGSEPISSSPTPPANPASSSSQLLEGYTEPENVAFPPHVKELQKKAKLKVAPTLPPNAAAGASSSSSSVGENFGKELTDLKTEVQQLKAQLANLTAIVEELRGAKVTTSSGSGSRSGHTAAAAPAPPPPVPSTPPPKQVDSISQRMENTKLLKTFSVEQVNNNKGNLATPENNMYEASSIF